MDTTGYDKGMDPALVQELQELFNQLDKIDLSALEKEQEQRKTSIERIIEDVKLGNRLVRQAAKRRPPGRPKLHWKTRIANRKKTKAKYYQNTWKPRRAAETAERMLTPEGWYEHITLYWKGERFSLEEWLTVLWPRLEGKVPAFKRDDVKKGWTLENVCMFESGTSKLLYCPEDWKLAKLGAIS